MSCTVGQQRAEPGQQQRAAARQARVAQETAQTIAAIIERFVDALGVPFGGAARRVLAGLLRQAQAGALLEVPAEAAEARRELVQGLVVELR